MQARAAKAWSPTRLARWCSRLGVAGVCLAVDAGTASAQAPPAVPLASSESSLSSFSPGPIALADGHVVIGGDVSASYGSNDAGFFNYTDYDHSALRLLRLDLTAVIKANDHLAILGDVQTENLDTIRPYALYLRIHPWTARDIDFQVGRIPPTFGAFSRRTYVTDNPLIGYPLAYQYLSTLRPDALPATVDELLVKRGGGWRVRYSVGSPTLDHGVSLVSGFRWDTGVQAHTSMRDRTLSATVSVTNGTISNPLFKDDNGGKQIAGRLEWQPTPGLKLGTSVSRGEFVADSAVNAAFAGARPANESFAQTAWGGDVEYSRDYYMVRAETIVSSWRIPFADEPQERDPLDAWSTFVEGRYKIKPGLYAAARFDHLGFSSIAGSQITTTWDAPVTRVEIGGGYSILRNLLLKLSYQHNTRDGGRLVSVENLVSTQVVFWF